MPGKRILRILRKPSRTAALLLAIVFTAFVSAAAAFEDGGEIVIDDGDSGTSSAVAWKPSSAEDPFGGGSVWRHSGAEYTWHSPLPETGAYDVYMWWTARENRATDAPVEILTSGGPETVRVDQRANGGQWNLLGRFPFAGDGGGTVTLKAERESHWILHYLPDWILHYLPEWMQPVTYCADAVKFVPVPKPGDNTGDDEEPEPAVNEKPEARIDGIHFPYSLSGNPVNFQGTGEDNDGTIEGYAWHSSLNGDLSTARSFMTSDLSPGRHVITFKVRDDRGAWSDPVQGNLVIEDRRDDVEQIFLCIGYSGLDLRPPYKEGLTLLKAADRGTHWELVREDRRKIFLFYLVEDMEAMRTALMTENSHIIYEGHSNYGLGGLFATAEETRLQKIYDVLYIDDDRIFNYSSPWVNIRINGIRTQQAFPFWWPVFKDGTSGIMPYDFGDPRGMPPYNYWITYRIPGDPVHYKLETVRNGGLDRFYGSDIPAWYDPEGKEPDPENPDHRKYFITNPEEWAPSIEIQGAWSEAFYPGNCYGENYRFTGPGTGGNRSSWLFNVPRDGYYNIDAWWCSPPDATDRATYRVNHFAGTTPVEVSQKTKAGQWNRLGEYYFEPGDYTVDLADDHPSGIVIADAVRVTHIDNPPQVLDANFYAVREGTVPMTVRFRDQSTGSYDSFLWDLGDGYTNSTRDDLTHEYTSPGKYTVSLTITGKTGRSKTTRQNFIVVGPESLIMPQVDFNARNRSGGGPLEVRFRNRSYGNFRAWAWDFGDGSPPVYDQEPTHIYERPGNYTVTLTATDRSGVLISETKENLIRVLVYENTIDNVDYPKAHVSRKVIVYGGKPEIREENLRFARMFYYGCNTGNYFLDTFHRGIIFYTVNSDTTGAVFPYLAAYVDGASDYEIWETIQAHEPVFDYYDFSKRPSEQDGVVASQALTGRYTQAARYTESRRMERTALAGHLLSIPLDEPMRALADSAFTEDSRLLLSEIPPAFEGRLEEAFSLAVEKLRRPAWPAAEGDDGFDAGALLFARTLFEAFPAEAVDAVLRAFENGTGVLRGNLILAAGSLIRFDGRIETLFLAALGNEEPATDPEAGDLEVEPFRLCDLAYNELVLHLQVPGVLRTLGPVHSLKTRDHHIGILKEALASR